MRTQWNNREKRAVGFTGAAENRPQGCSAEFISWPTSPEPIHSDGQILKCGHKAEPTRYRRPLLKTPSASPDQRLNDDLTEKFTVQLPFAFQMEFSNNFKGQQEGYKEEGYFSNSVPEAPCLKDLGFYWVQLMIAEGQSEFGGLNLNLPFKVFLSWFSSITWLCWKQVINDLWSSPTLCI